jgi:hypothetical protein
VTGSKEMYKIKRSDFEKGNKEQRYRLEIINNPSNTETGAHPDAHIPGSELATWKNLFNPD